MTPQEALADALTVVVTDGADSWRLVPMTLDGGISPTTPASTFSEAILAALAEAGMSIDTSGLRAAAQWLVDIHADDTTIDRGSALWEDLQRLRAALDDGCQTYHSVAAKPAEPGLPG